LRDGASTGSKRTAAHNTSVDGVVVETELPCVGHGSTELAADGVFEFADPEAGSGGDAGLVVPELALGSGLDRASAVGDEVVARRLNPSRKAVDVGSPLGKRGSQALHSKSSRNDSKRAREHLVFRLRQL